MKKIFKYQLKDLALSFSIFALIMLLFSGSYVAVAYTHREIHFSVSSSGFTGVILCLVYGIALYKEHCQMAILNSVSRKDFFKSNLCIGVIMSALCALLDHIILAINRLPSLLSPETYSEYKDTLLYIRTLYPQFFEKSSAAAALAVSLLFIFLLNAAVFSVGALIAGIYCRIPKKFRTAYCIALPVFGCGISPFLFIAAAFNPGLLRWFSDAFLHIMGISSGNPLFGILTFTVFSIAVASVCYRILRKTAFA